MKYWDKAWSLTSGCTKVSDACLNCWAEKNHNLRLKRLARFNHPFNDVRLHPENLYIPHETKKPTVFAVWNDLFHEDVPFELQADAVSDMEHCKRHIFLILTKRPHRMAAFMRPYIGRVKLYGDMSNIWFGTTVEHQRAADERIPHLLKVPGNRFISYEPALGPVDLRRNNICAVGINNQWGKCELDECKSCNVFALNIHAVIVGGETGPRARPAYPDWFRSVRDQCERAGVPFFFKGMGRRDKSRLLDGREHNELPWGAK